MDQLFVIGAVAAATWLWASNRDALIFAICSSAAAMALLVGFVLWLKHYP